MDTKSKICCGLSVQMRALLTSILIVLSTFGCLIGQIVIISLKLTNDESKFNKIDRCGYFGLLSFTCFQTFISSCLLYGIWKKKKNFIKPWLVINMILIAVSCVRTKLRFGRSFFSASAEVFASYPLRPKSCFGRSFPKHKFRIFGKYF